MPQTKPEKVNLRYGAADQNGITHKTVKIGNVVKAEHWFLYEAFKELSSPTHYLLFLLQNAISEFGSFTIPIQQEVLLKLDSYDFNILEATYERFRKQNGKPEIIDEKQIKLAFGVTKDGLGFDLLELGKPLKASEINKVAERYSEKSLMIAHLVGKEVFRLKQSNGNAILETELSFDDICEMEVNDAVFLINNSYIFNWKTRPDNLILDDISKSFGENN